MKILPILCLSALLSFAVSCKKEVKEETTVEQKEQGTLPETTDSVAQPADTLHSAETPK